jgi:hypothetical protein
LFAALRNVLSAGQVRRKKALEAAARDSKEAARLRHELQSNKEKRAELTSRIAMDRHILLQIDSTASAQVRCGDSVEEDNEFVFA